jgi:glucose-1-phosphate thymidylyltransferase
VLAIAHSINLTGFNRTAGIVGALKLIIFVEHPCGALNLFDDNFAEAMKGFTKGARVFAKEVSDPQRFGIVAFDANRKVTSIVEKPKEPQSNFAVTGLYIYDNTVVSKAKSLTPSARGEIEITDLNNLYLAEGTLDVAFVEGKWLDTGTFESLYEAITFARDKELANAAK